MKGFRLAIPATRDIEQIWVYIAEDNFLAGRRVRLQILKACRMLAKNPQIGHRRPDLTDKPLRFWPEGRYLIVYDPAPRPIEIVRVLHGARDVARTL
jgi:toxin ParE1/3/4